MYRSKLTLVGVLGALFLWAATAAFYMTLPGMDVTMNTSATDLLMGVAVSIVIFGSSGYVFGLIMDKT